MKRGTHVCCVSLLVAKPNQAVAVRASLKLLEAWLRDLGCAPNYAGVRAPGSPGNPVAYGRIRKQLEEEIVERSGFAMLSAMPEGDRDFGRAPVHATVNRAEGEALIGIDTSVHALQSPDWISLVKRVHESFPFVYGYQYVLPYEAGPAYYAGGVGYTIIGRPTDRRDDELRMRWHHALMDPTRCPRDRSIREVYRLQWLSEGHVRLIIEGMTLRQWIQQSSGRGILEPLGSGVWTWQLPDDQAVARANLALYKAGLLVAWVPDDVEHVPPRAAAPRDRGSRKGATAHCL